MSRVRSLAIALWVAFWAILTLIGGMIFYTLIMLIWVLPFMFIFWLIVKLAGN